MVILGFLRPVLSPIAGFIAVFVLFLDFVIHQLPISGGGIGYHALVFVSFYLVSLAVIKLTFLHTRYGPILIGLFGATLFAVVFNYIEPVVMEARLLSGFIHFGLGMVAALIFRRIGK